MTEIKKTTSPIKKVCNRLFFVDASNCVEEDNIVTLKEGVTFSTIQTIAIDELKESLKSKDNNPFFEQELSFDVNNEDVEELNDMIHQHFIVFIPYSDSTYKRLGSVNPYNPAILSFQKSEIYQYSFQRSSEILAPTVALPQ